MRTYTSDGTTYHLDVPRGRQANDHFAHREDWSKHCTLCDEVAHDELVRATADNIEWIAGQVDEGYGYTEDGDY